MTYYSLNFFPFTPRGEPVIESFFWLLIIVLGIAMLVQSLRKVG